MDRIIGNYETNLLYLIIVYFIKIHNLDIQIRRFAITYIKSTYEHDR